MNTYDYYGVSAESLEKAVKLLERALGIKFEPHDSLGLGDYYLCQVSPESSYKLISNIGGKVCPEPQLKGYRYVLQCNALSEPDRVAKRLRMREPTIKHELRVEVESGEYMRDYGRSEGKLVLLSERKL